MSKVDEQSSLQELKTELRSSAYRPKDDKSRHIDKRAAEIVEHATGDLGELLTTKEVSAWLKLSPQWFEIARHRGYGPPYVKLTVNRVLYRRSEVLKWLDERTFRHTKEYTARLERKSQRRRLREEESV